MGLDVFYVDVVEVVYGCGEVDVLCDGWCVCFEFLWEVFLCGVFVGDVLNYFVVVEVWFYFVEDVVFVVECVDVGWVVYFVV